MFQKRWCLVLLCVVVSVMAAPKLFRTEKFRIGIEYESKIEAYHAGLDNGNIGKGCMYQLLVAGMKGLTVVDSLPMYGGSDRYRHRNNYEPFFVTVTATAKSGFVISYLDVTATVDEEGEVIFNMVRGQTGSKSMVFQLISNHSDFLSYSYLTYGIREAEYKKITNVITLPMSNQAMKTENSCFILFIIGFFYTIHKYFIS